jgi:FkbM family methyltransferase
VLRHYFVQSTEKNNTHIEMKNIMNRSVYPRFALELINYRYGDYDMICPKSYYQFMNEVFILDVYRTSFLKKGDLVLDLGAATGDFCILASKKVGEYGKVVAVEPNIDDFNLLKANIDRNRCKNITPVNLAVGSKDEEKEMIFWGRKFHCRFKTLEGMMEEYNIRDKPHFIKMDIEGEETEVVRKSLSIVLHARVISLEFHGTKEKMDDLLLTNGFLFKPITMNYVYKKLLVNSILHPAALYNSVLSFMKENRFKLRKLVTGFDMTKDDLLTGSYVKYRKIL